MSRRQVSEPENVLLAGFFELGADVRAWIETGLEGLPSAVRPTHFGESERIRRNPTNQLSDRKRFNHFVARHRGGFFLYGTGFFVDITISTDVASKITFWGPRSDPRFPDFGPAILTCFDAHGATYGFGCDWGEYRARNGYVIHYVDRGRSEGWCGRDFRRYVPGLYWLNYFSDAYLERFPVDLPNVVSTLKAELLPAVSGKILRLYENPLDWEERCKDVADVIHRTDYVFSIRDVVIPTDLYQKDSLSPAASPAREWP